MKAVDLTKTLKPYKSGWVAINKTTNKVVAHAETFETISKRIEKADAKNLLLVPASDRYFGFITLAHG